jgi:hypothetical protein
MGICDYLRVDLSCITPDFLKQNTFFKILACLLSKTEDTSYQPHSEKGANYVEGEFKFFLTVPV